MGMSDDIKAGFDKWVRPPAAVKALIALTDTVAIKELTQRLEDGLLVAATSSLVRPHGDPEEYVPLSGGAWKRAIEINHSGYAFWKTGTLKIDPAGSRADVSRAYDVRFHPEEFAELVTLLVGETAGHALPAELPVQAQSNRGRPPWGHWDEVWAGVAALLARNELVTTPQARIEEAMRAIAERYPYPPDISAIRIRAKKLTDALKK